MAAKRILILTNRVPYPLNDGGNLAMHAMIDGYYRQGWQVYLLAMNTTRHYITPDVTESIYTDIAAFETVDIDNHVKPIPTLTNYLFSNQPNHAVRFYQQVFADKLKDAITRFAPHVIQFESVFLTGYIPLVRKLSNAITVLRLHNIEYQVWQRLAAETKPGLRKRYLSNLARRIEKYEKEAWRRYDLLLPITGTDATIVQQSGAQTDLLTIPFGIDIAVTQNYNNTNWSAYHIGAMDWLPNQEAIKWFLQDVWPSIYHTLPDVSFYYAGRNMPQSFNEMKVPGTHCMGEVPNAGAFIADKKILVVPLRSAGGIRVKILEAMAAGKVIVSTAVGMQGINAIDGIHYLQADTPQAFLDKFTFIFENKDKASHIANTAQTLVKEEHNYRQLMQTLDNKLSDMLNTSI